MYNPEPGHTKDVLVPLASLLSAQHYKASTGSCLSYGDKCSS